jgi:hypothetical protein
MTELDQQKVDVMVDLYIKCRDWIKAQKQKHEDLVAPKKKVMETIEGILQTFLDKTGQTNGACKTGTFYTTTKYSATISDKQEFKRHVIGTEAWDLIDWKANVQAARDFEKEEKTPLPGVTISAIAKIGVRRPGAKTDEV